MITALVASRADGNSNSNLPRLLQSLHDTAVYSGNFEVLVKLDDDEPERPVPDYDNVRYYRTPRRRGYADLHLAYKELFEHTTARSSLIWVLADDVVVKSQGWDDKLLRIEEQNPNKAFVCNFHMADFDKITERDAVEAPDIFPVWSRNWVNMQGWGGSFNTDGWTALVCHKLNAVGKNRRVHVPWLNVERTYCENDVAGSPRWDNERAQAIEWLMGDDGQRMARDAVARSNTYFFM